MKQRHGGSVKYTDGGHVKRHVEQGYYAVPNMYADGGAVDRPGIGDFLSWLDNKKRVAARNLSDLVSSPRDFDRAAAARLEEDLTQQFSSPEGLVDFVAPGAGALAGVIKPTGPLTSLLRGAAPLDAEARAMGQMFAARSPEEYFQTFKRPTTSLAETARQYGVDVVPEPSLGRLSVLPSGRTSGGHAAMLNSPEEFLRASKLFKGNQGVQEYLSRLDPQAQLYEIDAVGTAPGAGVGQVTYPAMFDLLSGQRGLTNVPLELTAINQMRRSLNTGDALMRNPALTSRILPHDTQLEALRGMTPSRFMELPREEQIGAMQLAGALRGAGRLDQLRTRRGELLSRDPEAARSLEMLDQLGVDLPPEAFQQFREEYGSPLAKYGLGETTLRKMGLIDARLGGRDVSASPLWRNLGKRCGGRV